MQHVRASDMATLTFGSRQHFCVAEEQGNNDVKVPKYIPGSETSNEMGVSSA